MAFYSAYFDESTSTNSPILVVVAGFLSTDAQWSLFERDGKRFLPSSEFPLFTCNILRFVRVSFEEG